MNTSDDGYDLFRRAIVERDADAWAAIVMRYRPIMIGWAARCPASQIAHESYENIADTAFARAWAALSPERFMGFSSLGSLLAYLRSCVATTAIDAARAQATHERAIQYGDRADSMLMELAILDRLDRGELWKRVASLVTNQGEQVALIERFVLDLPPRMILVRHPELFTDVTAIYAAIRNLCDRLRRNQSICRFYEDRRAA